MGTPTIWTIGHSTRAIEDFLQLLTTHGVERLVDVRLIPFSRRNPQFNSTALQASLSQAGIAYVPMTGLGGRRTPRPDSPNRGWRNASFRGYADYMQTDDFSSALEMLMTDAKKDRTAIMCAEAVPWRCHRSLISDALVTTGWDVCHIVSKAQPKPHELTSFATIAHGRLIYPGQDDEPAGRLF
jgi:uncharacterized protein (DUF488 family)